MAKQPLNSFPQKQLQYLRPGEGIMIGVLKGWIKAELILECGIRKESNRKSLKSCAHYFHQKTPDSCHEA